jgi:predicted transcriptional regulator YheO
MKPLLKNALSTAEAFCKLLHPLAEVVIHDFATNKIAAIFNPFSKRQVGDASYLDEFDLPLDVNQNVIGPYEKTHYDGQKLKSISIVLRDEQGAVLGFLCVNMNISAFSQYQQVMQLFLGNNDNSISNNVEGIFKDDLYEQINIYIQGYCREHQLNLDQLNRKQKQLLMNDLQQKGAFKGKNATNYTARILGVSRATVYNYLKKD